MPAQANTANTAGLPEPLGPEQTYFHYLQEKDWRIPHCRDCGNAVFYPRIACPACGGQEFDWLQPSGLGTIYSTTVMRRPPKGGGASNLCLVDLEEGVRMMSRIEGVPPEVPRIGDRVRAFVRSEGEQNIVVFRMLEDGK